MDKIFRYSLLKYRPSAVLDEQVNVGILFIFLGDNKVTFLFPQSLNRLNALYPDIDLQDTKQYLYAIQEKANQLARKDLAVETAADNFIDKAFFLADANSFFFSEFKAGIYETNSIDKIIQHFSQQYFKAYNNNVPLEPVKY